jgi:hypothetical protein
VPQSENFVLSEKIVAEEAVAALHFLERVSPNVTPELIRYEINRVHVHGGEFGAGQDTMQTIDCDADATLDAPHRYIRLETLCIHVNIFSLYFR